MDKGCSSLASETGYQTCSTRREEHDDGQTDRASELGRDEAHDKGAGLGIERVEVDEVAQPDGRGKALHVHAHRHQRDHRRQRRQVHDAVGAHGDVAVLFPHLLEALEQ